ncbi:MAG: transposase [Deltaproteobacteria bacterium]|nr:transposase [Deltaproteobacteria bacterium]
MPRPGLRISEEEEGNFASEFQDGRFQGDLDKCLRIQALLLVSRGNKETDVAQILGVGRRTLQCWIHRYRLKGIPGLTKGPFKGSESRLTEEQRAELTRIIAAGPQQAGLDTGVWTTPIIVKLVRDLFGVSYHPDHAGKILHRLGLSVQRPARSSSKADEKAQRTWRLQKLPAIKKN